MCWCTSSVQKRSCNSNADARAWLPTLLCGGSRTSVLGGYEMLDLYLPDQPKSPRSDVDFTSLFALTKSLPSSLWDYLERGWGGISRFCGISGWFFQHSGILQFWSQERSGFLTTHSKISICFILLRRRFKERRLIRNDGVCPFCFWLSFSQTFQENFICLCYELNFLTSMLPRGHDTTWELLIGICLLPSAAQNQLEPVVHEMWKKNENNFLFAVFEVVGGKPLRV